ncbi:MAG TPA: NmrA family NAD(P)-binding protein [Cytophagaceae bacterium]|nr:NmrA family NAD(P)-binding protein [Cytophagaceae bacterium]
MKKTYVITGATGNIGSVLVQKLLVAGNTVKAIGRSAEKLAKLKEKGAEILKGDLDDSAFLTKAFTGADAVFAMIPPDYMATNARERQQKTGRSLITAIKNSKVKNVVALSSLGANLLKGAGIVQGLSDFEQEINKLQGVNVKILRPGYFMENLYGQLPVIQQMSLMGSAVKADLKFPIIATKDIADVAAKRLSALDFSGISIENILGPKDLNFNEITSIIGKAIGKPALKYVQFPEQDAAKGMMQGGLSKSTADALVEFSRAMNNGEVIAGVKRTPENSTPTGLEEFAKVFAMAYSQAEPAVK